MTGSPVRKEWRLFLSPTELDFGHRVDNAASSAQVSGQFGHAERNHILVLYLLDEIHLSCSPPFYAPVPEAVDRLWSLSEELRRAARRERSG
jgi:hypothetical protein